MKVCIIEIVRKLFCVRGAVDMRSRTDKNTMVKIAVLLLVSFIVFINLFWRMVVLYPGPSGNYFSDIYEHLLYGKTYGIKGEYSLTLLINDVLLGLGSAGSWLVAAHLALIVILEIVFGYLFMKKIVPQGNAFVMHLLSLASLVVLPPYIPAINRFMYRNFTGNCWHSENYHGMRAVAILIMLFLFDRINDYIKNFDVKRMIIFALLLSLVNAIKPNFILGFAPSLLVVMIADITKSKGRGFSRWVMFGMSVLISLPVLLWQYFVNFDPSVETSENTSLIFVLGDFILMSAHPFLEFLTGMAFPLAILIAYPRECRDNKLFRLAALGFVFSFLEMFFIAESGERFYDGNMGWGLQCFVYIMFLIAISIFYKNSVIFFSDRKRGQSLLSYCSTKGRSSLRLIVPGLLFMWHLGSGLMYFIIVCLGVTGYRV